MEYKVSFVISPAKGGLGLLFSMKGRYTEGVLKIRPGSQDIHLEGVDPLVSRIDREFLLLKSKSLKGKVH